MRDWLKRIRVHSNYSIKETAYKAGLSTTYYFYIESGSRGEKLPVQTAKAIAEALDFDWTWFYCDDEEIKKRLDSDKN